MTAKSWQNRIVGEGEESPDQLLANPANWRRHPAEQREALRGILREVGWVQRIVVNKRSGFVIDGHARIEEAISNGESKVPVVYVDLSPAEESLVLAVLDPIGAMATRDQEALDALLDEAKSREPGLQALLDQLAGLEPEAGTPPPTDELRVTVKFRNTADLADFAELIGQRVTTQTRAIWFPPEN